MSKHTFKPNDLAKIFFGLTQNEYHFDNVKSGLMSTLGEEMYEEWIPPQNLSSQPKDTVIMSNMSKKERASAFKRSIGMDDYNPIVIGQLIHN